MQSALGRRVILHLSRDRSGILWGLFILGCAPGLAAWAGEPATITPVPVLMVDDPIAGHGRVQDIIGLSVTDGGSWLVWTDTTSGDPAADQVGLADGTLLWAEGQTLVAPGAPLLDEWASMDLAPDGAAVGTFVLDTGAPGALDSSAVLLGDLLLAQEGDPANLPGLPAGSSWALFFHALVNGQNQALVKARVEDPPGTPDVLVRWDLDASGITGQLLLVSTGDLLPGSAAAVSAFGFIPGSRAFNDAGQVLYTVQRADGSTALYRDQTLLVQQGDPIAATGEPLGGMLNSTVDLNDGGSWLLGAHTDTGADRLLLDGELLVGDGDGLPAPDGFTLNLLSGGISLGNNGNVLWRGSWNDSDPFTNEGLFLNRSLLVRKGESGVGGQLITSLGAPILSLADLSEDGTRVLFSATLEDGSWGVFAIDVDPWVDLGAGLGGTGGALPVLAGSGPMTAASSGQLALSAALPGASAWLVLGLSDLSAPFKGGTLVPDPDAIVGPFAVDGGGALTIPFVLPEPLPSGVPVFMQVFVSDPGAPAGFAASNALVATTI